MRILPEGVQEQRRDGEAGCQWAALWSLCWLHEQVSFPDKNPVIFILIYLLAQGTSILVII